MFAWRRGDGEPLLGGDPFPRPRPEECDEAERAVVERLVTALDARPGPAPPPRLRLDLSGGVGGRVGAPGPEGDVTFAMAAGLQRGSLGISARLRVARGATRRVDLPNGSSRPASIATDEIEIGLRLSRLVAGGRGAIVGELGGARPSWQGGGALEGLDGEAIPLSLPVLPYAAVEGRVLPARVPVYFATALLGSVPWQLDDPDRGSLYRSPVGSVGVEVGLRWP